MPPHFESDFLGPYLVAKEGLYRPMTPTRASLRTILAMECVAGGPDANVELEDGATEVWLDCGSARAYAAAKETLRRHEFESFAAMEASFSVMSSGAPAGRLYPCVLALHPLGWIDYKSSQVQRHLDLAKALAR